MPDFELVGTCAIMTGVRYSTRKQYVRPCSTRTRQCMAVRRRRAEAASQ